jgi:hypothetical protein
MSLEMTSYPSAIHDLTNILRQHEIDMRKDEFHSIYNKVLGHWFSPKAAYIVKPQILYKDRKPEFVITSVAVLERAVLLVVKLKHPHVDNNNGRLRARRELTEYMEQALDYTSYDMVYGLAGVGLMWSVTRLTRAGSPNPVVVQDWRMDITSKWAYHRFSHIVQEMASAL